MSKLTLDALKERAGDVASDELLTSISGGTENSCHTDPDPEPDGPSIGIGEGPSGEDIMNSIPTMGF